MNGRGVLFAILMLFASGCNCHPAGSGDAGVTPSCAPTGPAIQLPGHLLFVLPEPGSQYTVAEYEELAILARWEATEPAICVSVSLIPLVEPGDFSTREEWLQRMSFTIDGQEISEYHSVLETDLEGFRFRDTETGIVVAQEPDGAPYRVCYAKKLAPGIHTATIDIRNHLGDHEVYSWQFAITD